MIITRLSRKILFLSVIILLLGVIFEIWIVNALSSYGEKISQIEKTSNELSLQNQILRNKLDRKSSLVEIKPKALNLGFGKIQNIKYLYIPNIASNF